MTEQEWLTTDDAAAMLNFVADPAPTAPRISDRKLRMFACACAWHFIGGATFDPNRRVEILPCIATAERAADGHLLRKGERPLGMYSFVLAYPEAAQAARETAALIAGDVAADLLRSIVGNPVRPALLVNEPPPTGSYLSDKRLWIKRSWLAPQVLSLAQAAYSDRPGRKRYVCNDSGNHSHRGIAGAMAHGVFHAVNPMTPHHHHDEKCAFVIDGDGTLGPQRLLVLSDALEEAGCADGPLLRHLRGWQTCRACGGTGRAMILGRDDHRACSCTCNTPHGRSPDVGWQLSTVRRVRGDWAVDLVLGKE